MSCIARMTDVVDQAGLLRITGVVDDHSPLQSGESLTLNNNPSGSNSITVFSREEDGSLKRQGATSIGGLGSLIAFADGTQGSIILTHDGGTRLFAVDAGSDQISAVDVDDGFGFGGVNPTGAVTAYRLPQGTVRLINGPVPDIQVAPCWMVITRDGRFAYTSDADSHTVTGYAIGEDGAISLLNANGVTGSTPADTFPLEESLSGNGHFLYVLDSRLLLKPQPGLATLSGFQIRHDGSLTPVIDPTNFVLPFSAIGLAAE